MPSTALAGVGGAGIVGAGLSVVDSGSITGGTSTLGQANALTFTGGTNSLTLESGYSITGKVVAFSSADTLALGGTTNASFDVSQIGVQYLGFGIFQKTGSSIWTLTGTNAAALPWTIDAGTLAVNGAMANATMTVNSGGALAGTGMVGATTINNGGTLAPGPIGGIGTLTINGSLAFASGALYVVNLNPTTSSFATVTGTASLAGTVQANFAAGSYLTKQYVILQSTGISGTFSGLTTLMLDPFVNGRGNVGGVGGGALGFVPEQRDNLPPDVALAYASILNKAPVLVPFEQRWSARGSAYGGANGTNGDAAVGSNNTTASTFGFAGGMDYHFTPYTVAGFALAGAGTNWGLANALGTGHSDALQVGAYGINWFGPAYLAAALAFSTHWFTTNRSALGDALTANFIGQSYGARVEGGWRYAVLPPFGVTPYGAV
jgi:uncharacterized protein with beta-barrel porin domain